MSLLANTSWIRTTLSILYVFIRVRVVVRANSTEVLAEPAIVCIESSQYVGLDGTSSNDPPGGIDIWLSDKEWDFGAR